MPDTGIAMPQERVAPIISDLNGHIRMLIYKKRLIAQQEAERREMRADHAAPAVKQPSIESGSADAFAVLDLMDPDNYFAKIQRMEMQREKKQAEPEMPVPDAEEPDLPDMAGSRPEAVSGKDGYDNAQSKETGREGTAPHGKGKERTAGQNARAAGRNGRTAAPPARDVILKQKKDTAIRGEIREEVLKKEHQQKRDKEMEVHELHRPVPDEMLSRAVSPQTAARIDEKTTGDLTLKAVARSAVHEMVQPAFTAPHIEPGRAGTEHAMQVQRQLQETGNTIRDAHQQQNMGVRTKAIGTEMSADGMARRDLNTIVGRAIERRESDSLMRQAALFTHAFNRPVMFRKGKDTLVFVKEGQGDQAETFAVINGKKVSDREATRFITNISEVLKRQGIKQGINLLAGRLSIAERDPYQGASKDLLPRAVAPVMEKERSIAVERK